MAVCHESLDVVLAQQSCICHDNGLAESEPVGKRLYYGDNGLALGDVSLVYLIADGISPRGNEQSEEYLRTGVLAVFREATFTQVVLLCCLKIKRCHVVEAYRHLATHDFLRVFV